MKGDIVVVPFPFSDLTRAKRRPALVLAELEGDDLVLCQITGRLIKDTYSIPLDSSDLDSGTLRQPSHVRPNRLFTADRHVILYRVAHAGPEKLREIIQKIIDILQQ